MTLGDRTFPRGCLLYLSGETSPNPDPSTGARAWDIEHLFMGNFDIEWNEFMDPAAQWVLVNDKSDGTGLPPFEYADFQGLFGLTF